MKGIFLGSLVTETTTAADQAVVAVNAGEQGPNAISEAVFHSDVSTVQPHIVGDVVSSGRENEKEVEKTKNFRIHYTRVRKARYVQKCK